MRVYSKSRIIGVFFYRGFAPYRSRHGDLLDPISNLLFNSRYGWDSEEILCGEKNSSLLRVGVQNNPNWWRAVHGENPKGSGQVRQIRMSRVGHDSASVDQR
jgi:hypothetical protein